MARSLTDIVPETDQYQQVYDRDTCSWRVSALDGLAIAKGEVPGTTFFHKFGNAPDFDTGDGTVDIWDGANDAGPDAMNYTYSATADIDSLSSSDDSDTQDIEVQGLDTDYNLVTQTITLTGQTPAALTTDLIRVFRLKNVGATDNAGTIYCYVSGGTVTAGVPQTVADIRALIGIGNNQTLMALYTVPAGKTAYLRSFFASTAGANKSANYIIDLRARKPGEVFQLKHRTAIDDAGTSHFNHIYIEPEKYTEKTDIVMRTASATANITGATVSAGFDVVLVDNT